MKKSDQLKQERTAKVEAQQAIVDKAVAEKRDVATFTTEESTAFDNLTAEIAAIDKQIERAVIAEKNELVLASRQAMPVETVVSDGEEKEKGKVFERVKLSRAFALASPDSKATLDGAEKELHEIGQEEMRHAEVSDTNWKKAHLSIPLSYLSRADQQTVTQDSGNYGGALVTSQAPRMVEALQPNLFIMQLGADYWSNLSGGNIPLVVDADFDLAFMAETTAITPQKKQYTGPTLSPNRLAGAVDISNQLLLQSSVGVENRIKNSLLRAYGRAVNQACIEGTTYITGLATYSGVNVASAAASVAASWTNMVELQQLIFEDDSTRENLGYIIHPRIEGKLKTTSKDTGSGQFVIQNNMLDVYKYVSTSLITPGWDEVPTYATFFGDFSQMVIGQWGGLNVTINPYSADLQNSLRLVINTYADMEIANPKAFARNLFISETTGS